VVASAEIYNYKRILERTLDIIRDSEICEENKKSIADFHDYCVAEGLSIARIIKYLATLRKIAALLRKPFTHGTKEDILELVRRIESASYSDWTKHDYKVIIKIFWRWLKKAEEYPSEVKWIKASVRNNHKLPEELMTQEEVTALADAAPHPRDKALLLVLYESGCRIGEVLSLKIKNVQFDEYGAQLIVNGKTGWRRVRVIASAPKLASWIDSHPCKQDPNAPLWVSLGTRNRNSALRYNAAKTLLKEIAKKAGIRKRVYPHLFRHSRATHLANKLTEAQLKQLFGWVQSSDMASVYVHLSGRDVDDALLKLHGIKNDEENREEKFKLITCSRCRAKNSPSAKFCNACGLALDMKIAINLDDARMKADKLMTELVKRPEMLDMLVEALEKMKPKES